MTSCAISVFAKSAVLQIGLVSALETRFDVVAPDVSVNQLHALVAGALLHIDSAAQLPFLRDVSARLRRPVLAIMTRPDMHLAQLCLIEGAHCVLAMDEEPDVILAATLAMVNGNAVMPQPLAQTLISGTATTFSDAEKEWLRWLACGDTIEAIANRVGYAERSMYRILTGVYARLGARNRSEAVAIAVQRGIIN